jgi:hypothetical protein
MIPQGQFKSIGTGRPAGVRKERGVLYREMLDIYLSSYYNEIAKRDEAFFICQQTPAIHSNALFLGRNWQNVDSGFLYQGEMKEIPLTQGKVTLVDDDNFEWLNQWKWCFNAGYVIRYESMHITNPRRRIFMHRLIMSPPEEMEVDHIDRDKLNNCRNNLRICTGFQNTANIAKSKRNTSGYKGVSFEKSKNRWKASTRIGKRCITLGLFKTIEEAAHAYDRASRKYRGEFAYLNYPEEWINRDPEFD